MDAVTIVPEPENEPVRTYAPGSPERASLQARLAELRGEHVELTQTIGGRRRMAAGERFAVVEPHRHASVLGTSANATDADVANAVAAAQSAAPGWAALPFDERAAVFLRAADLLAGPWRDTINAATMLGQSKSVQQAEIDSACELIDFLRFNVHYARRVIAEHPRSAPGEWNRMDWRPLDGFVTAITPFNFTAIAGNLPTVPALMGNTVVSKPTPTQQVAAHHTMRLLEAAGLPDGVINMVTGDGVAVSRVALTDPDLAGLHFTGSSATFKTLWRTIAENLDRYRSYPRIVGETGGKDFVVVHPSADPAPLTTALVRGAFEYQGQNSTSFVTSEFQNRRTDRSPSDSNRVVRSSSSGPSVNVLIPSSSTTILCSGAQKSTMYRPRACCRRNLIRADPRIAEACPKLGLSISLLEAQISSLVLDRSGRPTRFGHGLLHHPRPHSKKRAVFRRGEQHFPLQIASERSEAAIWRGWPTKSDG